MPGIDWKGGVRSGVRRGIVSIFAIGLLGAPALSVRAQTASDRASGETTPPEAAPPDVGLDDLLRLPDSYSVEGTEAERRGGADAKQWQERFQKAHADVEGAREALERSQAELANLASESGNYQVTAPGASNPENSPVSFSLRQKLREQRAEQEASRRALRQLEIEADLASVPEEWRIGPLQPNEAVSPAGSALTPGEGAANLPPSSRREPR